LWLTDLVRRWFRHQIYSLHLPENINTRKLQTLPFSTAGGHTIQSAQRQCLPNASLKAKFHYAILVADRSETGRRPVADRLARASSLLASQMIDQIPARCRSATSFGPVCDRDSVMEFGLYQLAIVPQDTRCSCRRVKETPRLRRTRASGCRTG